MTILTQLIIIYGMLIPFNVPIAMDWWQLLLLVIATSCLTAGGNVINDIQDVPIDRVNKPEKIIVGKTITEDNAFNIYIALTIIAVVAGFVLCYTINRPVMATVFVLVAFLLYIYATTLKSILLVGNVLISIMVALVILITGIFEMYPIINYENQAVMQFMFGILWDFALFAFFINLIREWIKDCEDVDGDHAGNRKTLAIVMGRQRAARFTAVFILFFLGYVGWYVYTYLYQNTFGSSYFIFLIMAPLMYVMIRLWSAEKPAEFHLLSTITKIVLLMGIISMALFSLPNIV